MDPILEQEEEEEEVVSSSSSFSLDRFYSGLKLI
jgi:hypothetical protein